MSIANESSYELLYEKKLSLDKGEENLLFSLPPHKVFLENIDNVSFKDNNDSLLNVHPCYERLGFVRYVDANGTFPDIHDVTPYNHEGKEHGVRRIYFDNQNNSNLKCEIPYNNGLIHGTAKYYTPDGILAKDCDYFNDNLFIERTYDASGNLKEEYDYGLKQRKKYSQNRLSSIEHNLKDGTVFVLNYDKFGEIKSEETYSQSGRCIKLVEHNQEKNTVDAEDMVITEYYDDSSHNIKSKGTYRDDKPIGQHRYYYPSGKIAHIKSFNLLGEKEGPAVSYHENGKTKALGVFKEDEIDGPFYGFNEQGELEHLAYFDNGKNITNEVIKQPSSISEKKDISPTQNINEQQTFQTKDPLSTLDPQILKRLEGELNALREFKNSDIDEQTKEEFVQILNEEMSSKGKNGMGLTPAQILAVKQNNPDLFGKSMQQNLIQKQMFNAKTQITY